MVYDFLPCILFCCALESACIAIKCYKSQRFDYIFQPLQAITKVASERLCLDFSVRVSWLSCKLTFTSTRSRILLEHFFFHLYSYFTDTNQYCIYLLYNNALFSQVFSAIQALVWLTQGPFVGTDFLL